MIRTESGENERGEAAPVLGMGVCRGPMDHDDLEECAPGAPTGRKAFASECDEKKMFGQGVSRVAAVRIERKAGNLHKNSHDRIGLRVVT